MSYALPTDGYGIYEDISPGQGVGVYGPRLQQIKNAGFRVVVNYALLYDTTQSMIDYINYAFSLGLRVAIALDLVTSPVGGSLALTYPKMYIESGSQGITNFNAFGQYVASKVKSLPGTWGYYIADEPLDTNFNTIKSFNTAILAIDSTKPTLIICDSDTSTMNISNFWSVHNVNWTQACSVGGDDVYPIGLTAGSVTGFTIGVMTGAVQSYINSNSTQSAMALQAFTFNNGVVPTFKDMVAMLNQALSHMQPRLILWFSYENIWGCPSNVVDSAIPPDASATQIWADLTRTLDSVPSRWMQSLLGDTPLHLWRCDDPLCFADGDDTLTTTTNTINSNMTRQQLSLVPSDLDPSMLGNGNNSAITLNTTGFPSGAHAFTMGCVLEYSALPGAGVYEFVMGIGTQAMGLGANIGYDGDTQNLTFDLPGITDLDSGVIPALNTPYRLFCTYDGTTAKIYVNGVLKASHAETLNITYGAGYLFRGTNGNNFSGFAKDIVLYNSALSATQIAAYENPANGVSTGVKELGNGKVARVE